MNETADPETVVTMEDTNTVSESDGQSPTTIEASEPRSPKIQNQQPNDDGEMKLPTATPVTTTQSSQESSPVETADPAFKPAPKKRLTLQERLALAASAKRKPSTEAKESQDTASPTPEPTKRTETSEAPSKEKETVTDVEAKPQKREPLTIPNDLESLDKENLVELLKNLSSEIKHYTSSSHTETVRLNNEISRLKKASAVPTDASGLAKKLQEKENQIKDILAEAATLSAKEVSLTQQMKRMKQRENALEDELEKALRNSENLNEKVKAKSSEIESIKELERGMKEERLQNEALQMRFEKLQKEYDSAYDELKELKFRRLDVQLESTRKQLEEETKLNNDLSTKLDRVTQEYEGFRSKMKAEVSDLELQIQNERSKFAHTAEDNMNEIRRLEGKIESLRIENESSVKINGTSSDSSNKAASASHSRSLDLIQLQYTQAQENWKLIESTYLKKIAGLESDLDVLRQKDIQHSKKIKTLTNDLKSRQNELSDLQDSEAILMTQLETLQKELQDKDQQLSLTKESFESLQKDFEQEKESFKAQLDAAEEEKTRLKNINKLRIEPQVASPVTQSNLYLSELNSANSYAYYKSRKSAAGNSNDNIALGESSTTPRPNLNGRGASFASLSAGSYGSYSIARMSLGEGISEEDTNEFNSLSELPPMGTRQRDNSFSATPIRDSISGSNSLLREPLEGYRSGSLARDDLGYDSTIAGGGDKEPTTNIQMMNKLSSHIRRLEIEMISLKDEVESLNKQKTEASKEIVRLLKENSEVSTMKEKLEVTESDLKELNSAYEKTLMMLGAKSEKVEELKADVQDLKEICREQVNEMVELQEKLAAKK